ncbi:hypothetical protein WICPIJ_006207 [Wickerhamomyces pijperi]|uniref:tRNA ligase kinase domain-containing protein n=1 Tax=Wickerhamomyces pijperi TaxID=599730 RepID=A0A9P8Q298_WICPI|nr:hypothetical protein WICPIJ_006207 [Wickerhamomyces pijperi]
MTTTKEIPKVNPLPTKYVIVPVSFFQTETSLWCLDQLAQILDRTAISNIEFQGETSFTVIRDKLVNDAEINCLIIERGFHSAKSRLTIFKDIKRLSIGTCEIKLICLDMLTDFNSKLTYARKPSAGYVKEITKQLRSMILRDPSISDQDINPVAKGAIAKMATVWCNEFLPLSAPDLQGNKHVDLFDFVISVDLDLRYIWNEDFNAVAKNKKALMDTLLQLKTVLTHLVPDDLEDKVKASLSEPTSANAVTTPTVPEQGPTTYILAPISTSYQGHSEVLKIIAREKLFQTNIDFISQEEILNEEALSESELKHTIKSYITPAANESQIILLEFPFQKSQQRSSLVQMVSELNAEPTSATSQIKIIALNFIDPSKDKIRQLEYHKHSLRYAFSREELDWEGISPLNEEIYRSNKQFRHLSKTERSQFDGVIQLKFDPKNRIKGFLESLFHGNSDLKSLSSLHGLIDAKLGASNKLKSYASYWHTKEDEDEANVDMDLFIIEDAIQEFKRWYSRDVKYVIFSSAVACDGNRQLFENWIYADILPGSKACSFEDLIQDPALLNKILRLKDTRSLIVTGSLAKQADRMNLFRQIITQDANFEIQIIEIVHMFDKMEHKVKQKSVIDWFYTYRCYESDLLSNQKERKDQFQYLRIANQLLPQFNTFEYSDDYEKKYSDLIIRIGVKIDETETETDSCYFYDSLVTIRDTLKANYPELFTSEDSELDVCDLLPNDEKLKQLTAGTDLQHSKIMTRMAYEGIKRVHYRNYFKWMETDDFKRSKESMAAELEEYTSGRSCLY